MALQPIKDEIVRRTDALVTEFQVPLHQSLLAEAEQARQVAEEAGNASAMVAALRLKAELTNQLDASAKSNNPVQCGTAELVRSLIGLFLEYGYKLKLEPLQPDEAYDIDRALRAMNRPPADSCAEEPSALSVQVVATLASAPAATARPEPTEIGTTEVFENRAWIQLVLIPGASVPKWEIRNNGGALLGYRSKHADAVALARP
jgi:hypothetical protein